MYITIPCNYTRRLHINCRIVHPHSTPSRRRRLLLASYNYCAYCSRMHFFLLPSRHPIPLVLGSRLLSIPFCLGLSTTDCLSIISCLHCCSGPAVIPLLQCTPSIPWWILILYQCNAPFFKSKNNGLHSIYLCSFLHHALFTFFHCI